jgi:Zn-dependent alcohol dehydrogenase
MDVKTAKAAILVASGKPLVIDEITLPDRLEHGQVLVRVRTSSICGAQINEIDAVKGPDKFLPHLLGHEALATVIETGPGVTACKHDDSVIMHWRPGKGMQAPSQCRLGHHLQRLCGGLGESRHAGSRLDRQKERPAARLRGDDGAGCDQQ